MTWTGADTRHRNPAVELPYEPNYDLHKLQPRLMRNDQNYEMMFSLVTDVENPSKLTAKGVFRSNSDYGGMYWYTNPTRMHNLLSYPVVHDFTGVKLSYDYEIVKGLLPVSDDWGQILSVVLTNGSVYYVRLWEYVVDRPLDYWEIGTGTTFPVGRTEGSSTGYKGHTELDFDNLYGGWAKYAYVDGAWRDVSDPDDWTDTEEDPPWTWEKVDPTMIDYIFWGFYPEDWVQNEFAPLESNTEFQMDFNNWSAEGDTYLTTLTPLDPHGLYVADDYDDTYNITPQWLIEQQVLLGMRSKINFYIGASHFYDKTGVINCIKHVTIPETFTPEFPDNDTGVFVELANSKTILHDSVTVSGGAVEDEDYEVKMNSGRLYIIPPGAGGSMSSETEYEVTYSYIEWEESESGAYSPYVFNILTDHVFNSGFEAWYTSYLEWAVYYGLDHIIHSLSMENVSAPNSWKQQAFDGTYASTQWTPTPYLVSFCSPDALAYYKKYALALCELSENVGIRPIIQLGEPWWWFIEGGITVEGTTSTMLVVTNHELVTWDAIINSTLGVYRPVVYIDENRVQMTSAIEGQKPGDEIKLLQLETIKMAEGGTTGNTIVVSNHGLVAGDWVRSRRTWQAAPVTTVLNSDSFEVDATYMNDVWWGEFLELRSVRKIVEAEGTISVPPCFYDASTREKHLEELGYEIPEYTSVEDDFNETTINWLQAKIGEFTHTLRDHVKAHYPDAHFTVLFFPPFVLDESRVSEMMRIVNFPKTYWEYPELDFFQIEDYDYAIYNQYEEHQDVIGFAEEELGYPLHKVDYFVGYANNFTNAKLWVKPHLDWFTDETTEEEWLTYIWNQIFTYGADAMKHGYTSFVWALAQIFRDSQVVPNYFEMIGTTWNEEVDEEEPWVEEANPTSTWIARGQSPQRGWSEN
jgi:hypothetical protein